MTTVSRALQPQDRRIECPMDRNLEIFLTSHIDFLFIFGEPSWRQLWIKSYSGKKSRGHWTSKTAKSRQSYFNGYLPYHCSFYYLGRARVWLDVWICVRSSDAQKQLARTSLWEVVASKRFKIQGLIWLGNFGYFGQLVAELESLAVAYGRCRSQMDVWLYVVFFHFQGMTFLFSKVYNVWIILEQACRQNFWGTATSPHPLLLCRQSSKKTTPPTPFLHVTCPVFG